jgi:hypothetical protein
VPQPDCAPDPLQYRLWKDYSRKQGPRIFEDLIFVENLGHRFAILSDTNLIY